MQGAETFINKMRLGIQGLKALGNSNPFKDKSWFFAGIWKGHIRETAG